MHFRGRVKGLRSSKVNDLDHGVLRISVEQQVLRFQITVHNFHRVAIGHSREHLLHNDCCVSLAIIRSFDNLVEQFSSTTIFCYDEVSLRILINLE